jgi:hypothetical protein
MQGVEMSEKPYTPIIFNFEVGHMKESIQIAMQQYAAELEEMIQACVDKHCNAEDLAKLMDKEVSNVINATVKEEIHRFYRYGEGAKVIKDAIRARLGDNEPDS